MLSVILKEGRLAKGFTQKELSELSNISIRSIQRIENGEITPRSYTVKTLAEILGLSFESIQKESPAQERPNLNRGQKIILSTGLSLMIIFLSWAFVAQSAGFPETDFEFLMYSAFVLLAITAVLIFVWRSKS